MKKYRIALTGFGEHIHLGLSPKTKSYVGKVVTYDQYKNIIMELGSSHDAILTIKEVRK